MENSLQDSEQAIYNQFHGKLVKEKKFGTIRKIWVLEGNDTPSGNATKKGYDPLNWILYDTYLTNIIFYDLLD